MEPWDRENEIIDSIQHRQSIGDLFGERGGVISWATWRWMEALAQ